MINKPTKVYCRDSYLKVVLKRVKFCVRDCSENPFCLLQAKILQRKARPDAQIANYWATFSIQESSYIVPKHGFFKTHKTIIYIINHHAF